MEAFWTHPNDVVGRIDAEYYRSEFVSAARRLQTNCTTRQFSQIWKDYNRIYIGIAGFQDIEDESAFTPYLRPVDITLDGQIQYDNLPWCLLHWLDDWAKDGCAKPGDLIIEVKGNTRKAAVVDERIPDNCIVSGSSYRIQLKQGFDPHFYQAFFLSKTGHLLKRRLTSNTTINYIDPKSFKRFDVPVVDEAVQRAIGNKVRKAERLRELAAFREVAADAIIRAASVVDSGPTVSIRPRWFGTDVVSPTSWAAEFNRTMEAQTKLDGVLALGQLLAECRAGDPIKRSDRRPGPYRYYGASGPIDWHDGWNTSGERILVAQDGTVGVAVVASGNYWANNHVWVCRLKPDYSQRAVARYLTAFYPYWAGLTTGSVVPKVTSENLERLSVPRVVATASEAGDLLERMEGEIAEASLCIEDARSAVEALIDGTIDEPALLAEGEAIERWFTDNPSPHAKGRD